MVMKNMPQQDSRTYAIMAKPIGAACNLRCCYCYYLEKQDLIVQNDKLMSDAVLETYIRQNLAIHGQNAIVEFAWFPLIFTNGRWLTNANMASDEKYTIPSRPMRPC